MEFRTLVKSRSNLFTSKITVILPRGYQVKIQEVEAGGHARENCRKRTSAWHFKNNYRGRNRDEKKVFNERPHEH